MTASSHFHAKNIKSDNKCIEGALYKNDWKRTSSDVVLEILTFLFVLLITFNNVDVLDR